MKLKHIFALILAVLIGVSTLLTFAFSDRFMLSNPEETFLFYASSYPVYALGSMILKDIPGMELRMLLQPQDAGLSSYTLSDWDIALIDGCDVLMLNGGGYEGFEASVNSGDKIVISTVSGLKYSMDDVKVLTAEGEETDAKDNPWLFLCTDGAVQMAEAITANMLAVDEAYTQEYYRNLGSAREHLDKIDKEIRESALDGTIKVAAGHKALYYTAKETGLFCNLVIDRLPAQDMTDEALSAILALLQENGISVILLESQAPNEISAYFEENGIKVIKLDIMTSLTEKDGIEAYGETLIKNARLIREKLGS